MNQLNDIVAGVVKDFVSSNALFTALDVSNKVKEIYPMARHREIRDAVRAIYLSDIEPNSYGKTPIQVSLKDGTTAEAILYHPLSDSWDLDSKYDSQKRAQSVIKSSNGIGSTLSSQQASVASVAADGTINIAAAAVVVSTPADLWNDLFKTSPSLFPAK